MGQNVYAIPSYRRADNQETLEYLRSIGVPPDDIYVFVQTQEDYQQYGKHSGDCHLILKAADGVAKARNNILNYFMGAADVVMMDDDISRISIGAKGRKFEDIEDADTLKMLIEVMLMKTQTEGAAMYGFYPVYNEFFMSDTYSTKRPVNTILGFPRGFQLRFKDKWRAKEDIELCGRILAAGGTIVRANNIAFKAKHRTNKGGVNEIWKSGVNEVYSKMLTRMYPSVYAVQSQNPQEIRTIEQDRKVQLKWRTIG